MYVGTGMRAACRFCTGFKNQKNSWGYPSNLYRKLGEKDKFFPLHFHMYVRTGMRAASMFCTRFKNKKNSGGTLLTLTHLQQTNRLFSFAEKANVHNNRSFCGRGSYTQVFLILRIIWYFCWLRGKKGMLC